ncbi:TadG family pilus assembly protein [Trinickia fusca]|uniref:Pilus assembly protein TadE n=1 Tax=Trinickia fusca TaxID=2419777 RepID=A0A494XNS3_9BURK|nr:TadG family pilus assembly protein [Trinickia fusca]RKP52300.1 pilus assembly protein TadE [Trinickia fusca]
MRHPARTRPIAQSRLIAKARQDGSVVLFFLLFLIPLLAFGAFAIDIARIAVARNELQNAADAAALAGAGSLMASASSGPNWSQAQTAATSAIALNAADGKKFSTGTIGTGYWNLTGTPAGMEASTITPGTYDAPAVQVTITRATNVNGGPIPLLLAGVMNIASVSGSATAVAVVTSPGTIGAGGLFPVALDQCVYNQYWDSTHNTPKIDPTTGAPYELQISNSKTYGSSCSAGQWTSFLTNASDVPTLQALMSSGNPTAVNIGDSIYLQPGSKTALYGSVPTATTVLMPVTTQTLNGTYESVVAFAPFYIDASVGGSGKYIQGHFVAGYQVPVPTGGAGPNYGAYSAPQLAS